MKKIFYMMVFITVLMSGENRIEIEVNLEKLEQLNPNILGANALYWKNTDYLRKIKNYQNFIKKLNLHTMRYPGGEVADNFDWKSNTLNCKFHFPYQTSLKDSKRRMDFDEFIHWSKKFKSIPVVVINLEQAFIENNLEKYANLAASWVEYANNKKNYNVKYWEIGNESYFLGTRFALSGEQYAMALNLFSKKMKAVDPSIKIGAIGPLAYDSIPLIERIDKKKFVHLRIIERSCRKGIVKEKKNYVRTIKSDKKLLNQKRTFLKSWWEIIIDEANTSFDFASVHIYDGIRKLNSDIYKKYKIKYKILKLREQLKRQSKRDIPIAITEYNIGPNIKMCRIFQQLSIAEVILNIIDSNVIFSNYWPVLGEKRALINKKLKPTANFYIFSSISENILQYKVDVKCKNNKIYTFATTSRKHKTVTLIIINKKLHKASINVDIKKKDGYYSYIIETIETIDEKNKKPRKVKSLGGDIVLPPLSFNIIKLKIQKKGK